MPQQELELILTRQWAGAMAMPVWVMGADGSLLYYNEPAEPLIGRRYDEVGEIRVEELASIFQTTSEDGSPLPSDSLAVFIALKERRPAHQRVRYRGLDGVWRKIDTTAFPLEGLGGRHLGAVVVFWEAADQ